MIGHGSIRYHRRRWTPRHLAIAFLIGAALGLLIGRLAG